MDLRERGKQRRMGRVLDAARRILLEEGPEGLRMRAIAGEAELSVRTLYNLFGSKAEVLAALAEQSVTDLEGVLTELAVRDPIERSRAIITVSIARFDAEGDYQRRMLASSQPGVSSVAFERARWLQEEALDAAMHERMLTRSVPARLLAHQVLAAWRYGALHWANRSLDRAGWEAQVLHAWACLLLGVARGATRARMLGELDELSGPMERVVAPSLPERADCGA